MLASGNGSSGSGSVFFSPAGSEAESRGASDGNGKGNSSSGSCSGGVKAAGGEEEVSRGRKGRIASAALVADSESESESESDSVGEDVGSEEESSSDGDETWETGRKSAVGVRGKGRMAASDAGGGGEARQALRQRRQARQVVDDE